MSDGNELPNQPRERSHRDAQAEPEPTDAAGGTPGLGGTRPDDSGSGDRAGVPTEGRQGAPGRANVTVPYDVSEALQLVTGASETAHSFLCCLYAYFHQLDDIVDQDKPVTLDDLLKVQAGMMHTLTFNEFWTTHKNVLWPIVHTSIMAYWESNVLHGTDVLQNKLVGHVLKSQYQDIAYAVAFVLGGMEHEMNCRRQLRYADFDN